MIVNQQKSDMRQQCSESGTVSTIITHTHRYHSLQSFYTNYLLEHHHRKQIGRPLQLTPPKSTSATTQTTPSNKELTAFYIQHSLQAIEQQLTISDNRLAEIERIITSQGNVIKYWSPNSSHNRLSLTQTSTQLLDSPQPQSLTPKLNHRIPLFNGLPESVRLSENDLSRQSCIGNNPGAFGVLLSITFMLHLYAKLFTAVQTRVFYSYRNGGNISKGPLGDSRKAIIE